ncbi:MAG: bifunctional diaminohydroxyphosphoribosylaminopyrimidine deaminase/5-amino-6-(5-phosphoribosylamino)uracil reductase RibD [Desulfobacteraceae bacterium]
MAEALRLAKKGWGFTSPNPMVGAVVVKNGQLVGRGYHEAYGGPHAEVNAIADAGKNAKDAELYVTLEPCNHTGKTPPCTQAILNAGIRKVIVAMEDPNPTVKGGGDAYLIKNGIEVVCGVNEAEARQLNESFIKFVTLKRPFTILKCAATLDGRIATKTGDSKWVSGPQSRAYAHYLRHGLDAIMVGIETVRKDNPSLTTRLDHIKGTDPIRIILDTHLSIPLDAKVLNHKSNAETWVICGQHVDKTKQAAIIQKGAKIVKVDSCNGRIDLDLLMDRLAQEKISSLLIEGGGRVIGASLSAGIVDKICFFYAPKILGGDDGTPICSGPGPELMKESLGIERINVHRFGDDIMIEGYITPFK